MLGIIIFIIIILLALIGVPLFIILGLSALTCFSFAQVEVSSVAVEIFRISSVPTLVSIPLFTWAGFMMAESGSPKRLLRLARAVCGHFPGGIAIVALIVCAFFTAFTGASGVTIIALGGLLYPVLREQNFDDKFSLGLLTTCGSLGLLFPPSLPLILYGVIAKVDIADLFKAGIIPGIVIIIIYSLWALKKAKIEKVEPFSWTELRLALKESIWEALLPVVVAIGIYGGFTTVSEMATLTALYVLILEFVIHKDLSFAKDLSRIILESMVLVGSILMILCCALGFTNFLVDQEIPMKVLEVMKNYLHDRYSFLLFLNIFLLVIGALKDVFSAIVVVVPLILPISREYGIHPVHLAMIFLTNLEIGYIAPPFGINLFISSARFKCPIAKTYTAVWPFLILSFIALMIITYLPFLSLMWVK
ncbi:MAG: TRAP transporter large permease subunit [Pseudomonadota bacterium]